MRERIVGPRAIGKPLQIAVDEMTGTTEATQHPGGMRSTPILEGNQLSFGTIAHIDFVALYRRVYHPKPRYALGNGPVAAAQLWDCCFGGDYMGRTRRRSWGRWKSSSTMRT
jgi:hypothetical protein